MNVSGTVILGDIDVPLKGTYVLHRKWTSYLILSVLSLTVNSPGSRSLEILIISPDSLWSV